MTAGGKAPDESSEEGAPPDGLTDCAVDAAECAVCDARTRWTSVVAHVHLCSPKCLAEASEFLKWVVERADAKPKKPKSDVCRYCGEGEGVHSSWCEYVPRDKSPKK